MDNPQRTVARAARVKGAGLHSGQTVELTIRPAPVGTGVLFHRVDLPDAPAIPAQASHVQETARSPRRTTIGVGEAQVQTIEHLMAALWGLGVDNLHVDITGVEVPGLDGSAVPFLTLVKEAGIVDQEAPKRVFTLREPLWVHGGDSAIAALPHDHFKISYTLSYDHPALRSQFVSFNAGDAGFENAIAPARTFCLEKEAQWLREQGLGKGANYENTLVVGEQGVIQNRLRFDDEFVRHKVLDLIGDLSLLGAQLRLHVIALKSGHPLNMQLLKKLWQVVEKSREAGIQSSTQTICTGTVLDVTAIQRILPHRYPFLLVDRIVELEPDKRAVGIKNVTINDYFFQGHFPNKPVMPGVLLIEALAQVGGVLVLNKRENLGKYAFFMSCDKVKFRKPVVPGDQLRLEVEIVRMKAKTGLVQGRTLVDGKVVAEGELVFALVDE